MLTLKGYFCKVNKYGRLKFRYQSSDETAKLVEMAEKRLGNGEYIRSLVTGCVDANANTTIPLHLPFDDTTFTVVMPKWIKRPPQDILSRVGMVCTIEVKMCEYNFTSEAVHNLGEQIVGVQLVFSKVVKAVI
jgi:hypothetical protein